MVHSRYNPEMEEFKGLCATIRYLVVRRSPEEVFFNYGFNKEKSRIIYLHYRRRVSSSFFGTIFNWHRTMIERGEADNELLNIYFFLPAITDRSEEINQYLNKYQFLKLALARNKWIHDLEVNLTLRSLIYMVWIQCLMQL